MWNVKLLNELWKDNILIWFKEKKRVDVGYLVYLFVSVYM